ncbi:MULTISPECIES: DUF2345 domain-containing protein [unclassified Caballeronia]|uniref:DUF2345 domain-containing protein n=1 Tax=unclassified Caballeronia TaxID=2646786 RepID=UPI003857995D
MDWLTQARPLAVHSDAFPNYCGEPIFEAARLCGVEKLGRLSVRGTVSLFAYQQGMRFIAAKGPWMAQAQSGAMSLAALNDVTVSSSDGRVVITAAKEVWIGAGGSYVQINGSGIVNGSPGAILEKGAVWDKAGADSMRVPPPDLPGEKAYSAQFTVRDRDGSILKNYSYRMEAESGVTWYGRTDENGLTERVWTASEQSIHLYPHAGPHRDDECDDARCSCT